MSRPRLMDHTVSVTLTLSQRQKETLASKAAKAGVSMSTLARWIFDQHFSEGKQNETDRTEL